MASLIEGYNYDIFISYRQKDNKGDKWVSEFVEALKTELESTFKEEVSVYFDINPHDGLLETHDVDESLKEKLKCLIFIPIISRTYCDPKSFAWEHEFRAFIKEASNDQFGLKVKLSGGNIASRLLPVLIHDLDPEDKKLVEDVLGGFIRGIEFIYKEPGINKPLKPDDDDRKNLNKTKYSYQINKVANAISEIIKSFVGQRKSIIVPKESKSGLRHISLSGKIMKTVSEAILFIGLVIGGYFVFRTLTSKQELEKSIAVLPFINDSPSDSNRYFIDGIMVDILNNLQTIKDLRVISRTSAEKFRNTTKSVPEIAKELGVNYIVEGSGQKSGNKMRLRVNLIRAVKEVHLWGNSYEKELNEVRDILDIQNQIAESITSELKAYVTPQEEKRIEKTPAVNLDAYEAVMKGNFYWNKLSANDLETALKYYELAKEKDPEYAPAYAGIGGVWIARQQMGLVSPGEAVPKAEEALMKAFDLDSTTVDLSGYYTWSLWDWEKGEKEFKRVIERNPNDAQSKAVYSHLLAILGRNEEALAQIEIAVKLDPLNEFIKVFYGVVLTFVSKYDEAIEAFKDALKIEPNYPFAQGNFGVALVLSGRYKEAVEQWKFCNAVDIELVNALEEGYNEGGFKGALLSYNNVVESRYKNSFWSPIDIAMNYAMIGDKDKALFWLETGFQIRDPNTPYLLLPVFDNLRDDTRFQDLCKRMNLPYK